MMQSSKNSSPVPWNLGQSLSRLREVGSLCDVTLICHGGKNVQAHRCILAAVSSRLHEVVLKRSQLKNVITVEDFSSESISELVSLMYLHDSSRQMTLVVKDRVKEEMKSLAKLWSCEFLLEVVQFADCPNQLSAVQINHSEKEDSTENEVHHPEGKTGPFKATQLYKVSSEKADEVKVQSSLKEIFLRMKQNPRGTIDDTNDGKCGQRNKISSVELESGDKQEENKMDFMIDKLTDDGTEVGVKDLDRHNFATCSEILNEEWKNCKYCSQFMGKKKGTLSYHKEYCSKAQFNCDKCFKPFSSQNEQNSHHCKKKPVKHVCDLCGKVLVSKDGLRLHKQVHDGIKNKMCPFCGKCFQRSIQLQSHVKRVHGSERPFVCKECNQTFALQFDLTKHMKVMHGPLKTSRSKVTNPQSGYLTVSDLYACLYCGVVFTNQSALESHEKKHGSITKRSLPRLLPKEPQSNIHKHGDILGDKGLSAQNKADGEKIQGTKLRIMQGEIVQMNSSSHIMDGLTSCSIKTQPSRNESERDQQRTQRRRQQPKKSHNTSQMKRVPRKSRGKAKDHQSNFDPLTLSLDAGTASNVHRAFEGGPSTHHNTLIDESQTASSILVSQFLDHHSIAANLATAMENDDDDDDMPLNLSYGQSSLPLSHTFGSFDSSVTITGGGMVEESGPSVVGVPESGVIYHSIMTETSHEGDMEVDQKERLQTLDSI